MVLVADEIERGYKPLRSIERTCETQCEYMPMCLLSLGGHDVEGISRTQFRKGTTEDYYGFEQPSL